MAGFCGLCPALVSPTVMLTRALPEAVCLLWTDPQLPESWLPSAGWALPMPTAGPVSGWLRCLLGLNLSPWPPQPPNRAHTGGEGGCPALIPGAPHTWRVRNRDLLSEEGLEVDSVRWGRKV